MAGLITVSEYITAHTFLAMILDKLKHKEQQTFIKKLANITEENQRVFIHGSISLEDNKIELLVESSSRDVVVTAEKTPELVNVLWKLSSYKVDNFLYNC